MADQNPLYEILADLPTPLPRIEDYLQRWAEIAPFSVAAIEGDIRLTYKELAERVTRMAGALMRQGVGAGDRVAVLAPPSIDFLVSFLATLRVGGTWLGINPKYTRREMEHVLRDAAPRLFMTRLKIAERDYGADIEQLGSTLRDVGCALWRLDGVTWELGAATPGESAPAERPRNEIAAFVYTSGSTGAPKAAQLTHRALIRAALVRARAWPVDPLRIVNNLPINHVGGLGDIACTALVAGGSQVFLEKFSPSATLAAIDAHAVSFWYQAPTMFEMCLAAPEARDASWRNLQAAVWSGGRPSAELVRRLAQTAPRLGVDYSMTESVGAITLAPLWASEAAYDGSVGWPDPYRRLRIGDTPADQCAAAAVTGEVEIKDDWMFAGYRAGGQDAYAADGWFRTGDIAVSQPNGAWCLVGRSKEMFKSGGYNVYPREIELVLEAHPKVVTAVVVDAPDPLFGEVGVAFVVLAEGGLDVAALAAHCRESLANYKVPKRFEIVDALPMLAIGKVDKGALRNRAAAA